MKKAAAKRGLGDLTQPKDRIDDLRAVAEKSGPRGRNALCLFSGPSGTGKTRAAEALAAEMNRPLQRVNFSALAGRYIGETEKNLQQVLDEAEAAGAILLFDEADALFGKRTQVKDSHDRYANQEVGYLLQALEGYRGLVILTSNQKAKLDPAHRRRLRQVIDFGKTDR